MTKYSLNKIYFDKNTKMFTSMCGSVLIATGSLIGLVIMLAVNKRLTDDFKLICLPEIKKCNGTNQLYHLRSQQCLQNGESNGRVCGRNMVIRPLTTCTIEGECECDYENNERHLVYHDATHQCYPIYSQGPCDDGYVVVISAKNNRLKCERDICLEEKSKVSRAEKDSIVPFKNKCYTLHTKVDEPQCTGELKFIKNQLYPSCSLEIYTRRFTAFTPLTCPPGSSMIFYGRCVPSDGFKFQQSSDSQED